MKRCVVESVAWEEAKSSGVNVSKSGGPRGYFECACVSMHPVAQSNPGVDRVLVTNIEPPRDCKEVLDRDGVRIVNQPFDKFAFSRDVEWHLAYYKLCALQAVLDEGNYDELLMLDTDTWVRKPLDGLFAEISGGGVGFYDLDAKNDNPVRTKMTHTAQALGFEASSAMCWGGEAICGSSSELGSLLDCCESVQRRMEQFGVYSDRGDEFLLFAAGAAGLLPAFRRLNPYIARIWTGRYFTPCEWGSKTVLHLPSEKGYAFPLAFKKIAGGSDLFENSFERLCGLRPSRRPLDIRWLAHGVLAKAKSHLTRLG